MARTRRERTRGIKKTARRLAQQKRNQRSTQKIACQKQHSIFYYLTIVAIVCGLLLIAIWQLSATASRSFKKKQKTYSTAYVEKLIASGVALLRKSKYREAESVLRRAKTILLKHRETCRKDTPKYYALQEKLKAVQKHYYHAYKHSSLK